MGSSGQLIDYVGSVDASSGQKGGSIGSLRDSGGSVEASSGLGGGSSVSVGTLVGQ